VPLSRFTVNAEIAHRGFMRLSLAFLFVPLLLASLPQPASSQGATAVPFLLIAPSPEANGMAGISVAVRRADPISSIYSPAQVGLASLSTGAAGSFYPEDTKWWGQMIPISPTYKAWAAQGGVLLNDFIKMPVRVGIGLAYHRVDINYGKFSIMGPSGPEVIGTFESSEYATGLTLGVGFEYLVKAGFGYTFRSITSYLAAIGNTMGQVAGVTAEAPARDYSGYLMLPVVDLVDAATGGSTQFYRVLRPFADLSLGFGVNNVGDQIVYVDGAHPDPLPRIAREGIGVAGGLRLQEWELASATWSREAEDLLVIRYSDGTWEYKSGSGDIEFGNNVIAGDLTGNVGIRTGWQLRLGEFFTYREGTYKQQDNNYDTDGFTFQLAGLLKGIAYTAGPDAPSWLLFMRDHVDVQYHQASQSSQMYGVDRIPFKALTLHLTVTPL
jgi:hypothetical protein